MNAVKVGVVFGAMLLLAVVTSPRASGQNVSASFQLFYDELSPHGMWVEYSDYGYVWFPHRDPGFSPYESAGHWVFTDDGWTWVSDYPWGWAPFHYGRWGYDDYYGWYWVPDNVWGPAWVTWRRSPGYYGWAPLRPGITISIAFGSEYRERNERWIFVSERDITRPDISRHYVDRRSNNSIMKRSSVITHTRTDRERNSTFVAGPEREEVQKATRGSVPSVSIRDDARPGQRLEGRELHLYRPRVETENAQGRRAVPSVVRKVDEVQPSTPKRPTQQKRSVDQAKDRQPSQVTPATKERTPQVTPTTKQRSPRAAPAPTTKDDKKKRKERG